MDVAGSRWVVAGASGELGSLIARELAGAGAEVGLLARDEAKLAALADELAAPGAQFDICDAAATERAFGPVTAALGGLDGVVVATGAVAFGPADELDPAIAKQLLDVNPLGPMQLIRAALNRIEGAGCVVAISAAVAEYPMAELAAYSAAKAGLSAYLVALRRELRRDGTDVIDVRPPHMNTGFAERPLAGTAPKLPTPFDPGELTVAIVGAIRDGKREVYFDIKERALVGN